MYECPHCGGQLRFDIKTQMLACDSCGSQFEPDIDLETEQAETGTIPQQPETDPAIKQDEDGADPKLHDSAASDRFNVQIFRCPNCGAQMMTTSVNALSYCSYCGTSAAIPGRLSSARRPQRIIPFQKTKEDCIREYRRRTRWAIFAPHQFKDPQYLQKFRGIYMPYWVFTPHFDQQTNYRVVKEHRKGNYRIVDYYSMKGDLKAQYRGIAYDASSAFNDVTGNGILPFDTTKMKPFAPGYLCGFYADMADISPETYRDDAEELVIDDIHEKAGRTATLNGYSIPEDSSYPRKRWDLGGCGTQTERAMLPVWFLTWRRKDRVAYAVMNGQNGNLAADLPVDVRRFTIGSLLLACLLFLLFSRVTLTGYFLLNLAQILTAAAAALYLHEIRDILDWEQRRWDKGYLYSQGRSSEYMEKRHHRIQMPPVRRVISFRTFYTAAFLLVMFSSLTSDADANFFSAMQASGAFAFILSIIVLAVMSILMFRARNENRTVLMELGVDFAAGVVGAVISFLHPAADLVYYLASILCLACVAFTMINLIRRYNDLVTRPVPTLFETGSGGSASGSISVILLALVSAAMLSTCTLQARASAQAVSGQTEESAEFLADIVIEDDADLLSDEEELRLRDDMRPVTEYGAAAFISAYVPSGMGTSEYAQQEYHSLFGTDSGILFLIDMENRNIWIYCDGEIYQTITMGRARTITDNVYRYASEGDYYTCASTAFAQALTLLQGGRISQPMRYISAALLSLIAAFFINYLLLRLTIRRGISENRILEDARISYSFTNADFVFDTEESIYEPNSSGSGGGGGGSSGGGGGGGGSSGGGGGHGF